MENEIVSIIINMIYSDTVNDLYRKKSTEFSFPLDIDEKNIPFNVIYDFTITYFSSFKNILIKNGFINAIRNKDKVFIDHFIMNLNDLDNTFDGDIIFQIKLVEYALKHLINKFYDKSIDDSQIINEHASILNRFDVQNINYSSATCYYRNIIMEFLSYHSDIKLEVLLEKFLTSSKYDLEVINISNNFINKDNIVNFKKILIRLIFTDNYIFLENDLMDEIDETEVVVSESNNDYEDEEYEDKYVDEEYNDDYEDDDDYDYEEESDDDLIYKIETNILKHIRNCINTNNYILPTSYETRLNLCSIFISYNSYEMNRKLDIEVLSKDKEKIKVLKKLNPLYKLDLINSDLNS